MSIEAILAAVSEVREQLAVAHQEVWVARERLAEAVGVLTELSQGHGRSLVPPEHGRAGEQLASGLDLIAGSLECLDHFVAGL